MKVQAGEGVAV